ncbi:hypothetical protein [Ramlibacter humi]|uniref:hypothetical protein n=1 Tax=Ramlibacter humi TaxID=2530451 RepID=UPI00142F7AE8|nr:hypothetical protein [Ramlibacter humi]
MTFRKTHFGLKVMKNRSVPMTPLQRLVFILVDGERTAGEILGWVCGDGGSARDFAFLLEEGLIEPVPERQPASARRDDRVITSDELKQRFEVAYPVAVALTSELGLGGIALNLAIERATTFRELVEVARKIRYVVGKEKFEPLRQALTLALAPDVVLP